MCRVIGQNKLMCDWSGTPGWGKGREWTCISDELGPEKGSRMACVGGQLWVCVSPNLHLRRMILTRWTGLESGRGNRNGWSAWLVGSVCLTVVRVALTAPGVPVRSWCGCRGPTWRIRVSRCQFKPWQFGLLRRFAASFSCGPGHWRGRCRAGPGDAVLHPTGWRLV